MMSASLTYLRDGDAVVVTVLIGGLLLLASPLVVPSVLALGYVSRVLRRTADGDDAPPAFEAWGDLLVEGAKAFVVAFVYSLLPIAALAIAGLAASLAGLYVTPAALAAVADSGRIGDGFAVGTLWTVVTKRAYATGWLTAAAVALGGALAVGVLSVVPVLGTIAGFFVQFYALVAAAAVIGWTWSDVRPVSSDPPEPEAAERAAV
ncbi:DUF4013 domain-containing protein [Halorubrum yunnanense]|uniref:DUF4013 domain-containing protein n=1 Tax=Halorubrum yunnanense TaxID=1526162 RepID=A0ABD5YN13_9EURY|nr:DUF4013 domain-containing protein [Halorubrum yunnanense]